MVGCRMTQSDEQRRQWHHDNVVGVLKSVIATSLGIVAAVGVWSRGTPNVWHLASAIAAAVVLGAALTAMFIFVLNGVDSLRFRELQRATLVLSALMSTIWVGFAVCMVTMIVGFL